MKTLLVSSKRQRIRSDDTDRAVYSSIEEATAGSSAIKTSQLPLPQADCEAVYVDDRCGSNAQKLSSLSLDTDNIFSDGWTDQLATVSGSADDGYLASLLVRI